MTAPIGVGNFADRPQNRRKPWLPPKTGHDERVARDLSHEWRQAQVEDPHTFIPVTGDLTETGKGREFGCAHRFLHAHLFKTPTERFDVGLNAGSRALTIPGNHDFLNGKHLRRKIAHEEIPPQFWPLPWVQSITDGSGLELHLVGIDSFSGLGNTSNAQYKNTGSVSTKHLQEAGDLLDDLMIEARDLDHAVIRVVLLHHPPNRLTNDAEMLDWFAKYKIQAVLTGHEHKHTQIDINAAGHDVIEMRCGTTIKAGGRYLGYNYLPGPEENHFFVHDIKYDEPDKHEAQWTTNSYSHRGINWEIDNTRVDQGIGSDGIYFDRHIQAIV